MPMAWRAAAAAQLLLGQLSLFPLRLSGAGVQTVQDFTLEQPQDKVVVAVGQTLTLTCTTSENSSIPGPVKWLKGWGTGNETIYDQTGFFPRVTRAVNGSNTDFTIRIRDVRPEDAGTYYCVKFRKSLDGDEPYLRGKGTVVSLHGSALVPSIVAAAVVVFLLLLGLFIALCVYRRKRRGKAESQCLAGPAAMGSFSPIPLLCCAGTTSTPSKVLDAETSHLPNQQSSKEDDNIHYADLQPLPAALRHGRSPGAASSEYASVVVAAK
ncbi:signal-regulatory protein beta-1-like [Grus japonensis]|uniref:Signal-regulatory protein beta-1-like n=1 Tax=Grus japonensis TaxID=30415 RepID=A0ABC9XJ11_GRUJA